MTSYIPTENPQKLGERTVGPNLDHHVLAYREAGPPPRNYLVEGVCMNPGKIVTTRYRQRYTNQSVPKSDLSWYHPLSADGLKENPDPIIEDEFLDDRENIPGFFQPRFVYKPGQWQWYHYATWQGALAHALRCHNVTQNDKSVQEEYIKSFHEALVKKNGPHTTTQYYTLYHPADRNTMIFEVEPACAFTLPAFAKFSLSIVCPLVSQDRVTIAPNRIYDTHNRPPVRARWSTGPQAGFKPIVLGCIPTATMPSTRNDMEVLWFAFEPVYKNETHPWDTAMWRRPDIPALALGFGFPTNKLAPHVFFWALVSLHRRIVLGYNIPEEHLGCWLWQYGQHLVECATWTNPRPSPFKYDQIQLDAYKTQNLQPLSFHRLGAWIMNSHFIFKNIWIGEHAKKWDEAIDAQIQYQLDKTSVEAAGVVCLGVKKR